jgi:hypothetical protein
MVSSEHFTANSTASVAFVLLSFVLIWDMPVTKGLEISKESCHAVVAGSTRIMKEAVTAFVSAFHLKFK